MWSGVGASGRLEAVVCAGGLDMLMWRLGAVVCAGGLDMLMCRLGVR